jgi:regulator of protease activity HflC (stomatin/prohibitin superfamily)
VKKILLALAGIFIATNLGGCSYVPAGHVGVKVYLLGTSKGVDSEELGVGRYWIGYNEELYLFPTFAQNYTWTRDPDETGPEDESLTFQDKDGTSLNADVGITYSIDPKKVTLIFQRYRKGVAEITDIYLRNMVRDALVTESSQLPVESIYGVGKAKLLEAVEKRVKAQVESIGINIERIYWIGDIRLPQIIRDALNAKIEANQKAQQRQNEIATARAEADKKIEDARGRGESVLIEAQKQAEANKVLNESITPNLILYKKLENEQKAIGVWTGTLPTFMGGSTPVPFINLGTPEAAAPAAPQPATR